MNGNREFEHAEEAAQSIFAGTPLRPRVALVLGSGLGGLADELTDAVRLPYANIPHFPQVSAEGHAGQLVIGITGGVPVAAMQGRVHLYEGHSCREVVFPMRVFGRMGIRAIILTNAAGGVNAGFPPGSLAVIRDHLNLQGANPLIGPNDARWGARFCDMCDAYYPPYRELGLQAGRELGIPMFEGVYAAVTGPSYETPAEIRYLRAIGADLVGMSTVAEVIAARHMGMRVLAVSCVTNMAAGILPQPITHEEVLAIGARVGAQFARLLRAVLPAIAADVGG